MARKYGIHNVLKTTADSYNYVILGEGDVGKTTFCYEFGKAISGSDEGAFIITIGQENAPDHINGAFHDKAPTYETLDKMITELCNNKEDYPDTKYICFDSLDELFRITEDYVVREWNKNCPIDKRSKSISGAYGGYQKGEKRVKDLIVKMIGRIDDAGYKRFFIGHTKNKNKTDMQSGIEYEQITCNLDNSYYNVIKDKSNLVGTAYKERIIEDIETKQNPFTKKNVEVGTLKSEKRVLTFFDDGFCIDTKCHFPFITPKIPLDPKFFIEAVEKAIEKEAEYRKEHPDQIAIPVKNPYETEKHSEENIVDDELEIDDITELDDVDEITEEETIDTDIENEESVSDNDIDIDDDIFPESELDEPEMTHEELVEAARQKATSSEEMTKKVKKFLADNGKLPLAKQSNDVLKKIIAM